MLHSPAREFLRIFDCDMIAVFSLIHDLNFLFSSRNKTILPHTRNENRIELDFPLGRMYFNRQKFNNYSGLLSTTARVDIFIERSNFKLVLLGEKIIPILMHRKDKNFH